MVRSKKSRRIRVQYTQKYRDSHIVIAPTNKGQVVLNLESLQISHEGRVSCLGLSADGSAFCTGIWDTNLKVLKVLRSLVAIIQVYENLFARWQSKKKGLQIKQILLHSCTPKLKFMMSNTGLTNVRDKFVFAYKEATPQLEYGRMNIGSRPSKQKPRWHNRTTQGHFVDLHIDSNQVPSSVLAWIWCNV
ncbi:guanine nucleotide-binding protein subunit beta-1 [Artemisia annua]|uniref:Guanine nucleotide-binding protein subunit beta-1 n=1 Tax=Artemisia annua TaxID=35608 RepID=A0A2U1N2I0_ARTAN|nr:guanine nucleotide-binding protein subunit beta-1 [Artemisia annua]